MPTVIVPVPSEAPIVRAAEADDGLILTMERLVPVAEVKAKIPTLVDPETNKLVEVALVEETDVKKALVEVMLLLAFPFKLRPLETYKLVVVTLVVLMLAGLKFVAAKLVKKAFVEVIDVPVAVVKPNAPDNVPPVNNR